MAAERAIHPPFGGALTITALQTSFGLKTERPAPVNIGAMDAKRKTTRAEAQASACDLGSLNQVLFHFNLDMRLHVLCDLHLEFGNVRVPPTDADVVVLAGDIHLGREGRRWTRSQFPDKPVLYVLGNHEFYRHSLPELTEALRRETDGSHIHVLENSVVEINGYNFLGCTLWTDFKLAFDPENAMKTAAGIMSDYSLIQFSTEKRVLRPKDTAKLHADSITWLRSCLAKYDPARTIIITHHAPSWESQAQYHANSPLAPAFASNLDSLVRDSGVPLWIHGHTHYNVDYKLGSTRVLTNQRGYPDDPSAGFKPSLVVEV
jgi:predicted phosphodiesterase